MFFFLNGCEEPEEWKPTNVFLVATPTNVAIVAMINDIKIAMPIGVVNSSRVLELCLLLHLLTLSL